MRAQDAAARLVELLLEKALAVDRVKALVQGHIVLPALTSQADLPQRLERACFGHESHPAVVG